MILFGSVDINFLVFGLWSLAFRAPRQRKSKVKSQRPKAKESWTYGICSLLQQFLRMPSRIGCDFSAGEHSRQLFDSPLSFKPLRADSSSILNYHFLHREVAIKIG